MARESTNPNDFALVVMLGLLDLRIFEAAFSSNRQPSTFADPQSRQSRQHSG